MIHRARMESGDIGVYLHLNFVDVCLEFFCGKVTWSQKQFGFFFGCKPSGVLLYITEVMLEAELLR